MNDNKIRQLDDKELDGVSGGVINIVKQSQSKLKECKNCGGKYRAVITDTLGLCPKCKNDPNTGKIL